MTQRPSFLTRRYLIHGKFQYEIVLYFLSFFFITVGAIYLVVWKSLSLTASELTRLAPKSAPAIELYSDHLSSSLGWTFALFGLVGGIFAFLGGILISHRAAGPLYRLGELMKQVSKGAVPQKVSCREHDYFPELFEEFERLLRTLESQKSNDR